MSVTEHLMRPGNGSVNLIANAPLDVTSDIQAMIEDMGCHIVITPVPMDPLLMSDASILAAAMGTFRITGRPSRTSLEFTGISSWRDSYMETALTKTAGTPAQWLTDLLGNGISVGSVSGGSNVTHSLPAYAQTYRGGLDLIAEMGGWEYLFQPDFTVDAGTTANVFQSPPTVVITGKAEGPDGTYIGLLGSIPGPSIDASNPATTVVALGQGLGASIVQGIDTQTIALKTRSGGTPAFTQVISAPTATAAGAATVAGTAIENMPSSSRTITVSTNPYETPTGGKPGRGAKGEVLPGGNTAPPGFPGGGSGKKPGSGPGKPRTIVEPTVGGNLRNAANLAARLALGQTGNRRSAGGGSAESQYVRRVLKPGDEVYVYDLEAGISDTTQMIFYRGEYICPALLRCTSLTWPCEKGPGYYIRSNAATPTYIDITPWIEYESPGAKIVVSDWTPASYGVANRSDPAVEQRVAGPGAFTAPTLVNSWVNFGGSTNDAGYRMIGDMVTIRGLVGSGSSASATIFTLPTGFRPTRETIVPARSFAGACELRITAAGVVSVPTGGSTTWNSMDGISFSTV